MTKFTPRALLAAGFLSLAGLIAGGSALAADVADGDFKALVETDAAHMLKNLKDGAPDKKGIIQSKAAAMMIAMYAQQRITGKDGAKDAQMATLRDQALKVAGAVAKKDYKTAFAEAGKVKVDIAADKSASTKAVALEKLHKFELMELMNPLKKPASGGQNTENDIKEMSEKLKDVKAVPAIALKVIGLADYTEKMSEDFATKGAGKKSVENWKKFTKQMKDAAEETYTVSTQPKADIKKVQAAMGRINASCTECHNVFKGS